MRYALLHRVPPVVVLMLVLGGLAGGVRAQATASEPGPPSLDKHLFDRVYRISSPTFGRTMRVADATAFPVFLGGASVVWLGVWGFRDDGDWSDAYRLTLSELSALGATVGMKYLVRRTRPYVRFPDIDSRTYDVARRDPYSFPSLHAALAFAQVTSWTLSHPSWYVAVPAYLWATSVAVSRVWLGVHYPSDIVFGALLGSVIAWSVHRLGSSITPAFLRHDGEVQAMPMIHLRLSLP